MYMYIITVYIYCVSVLARFGPHEDSTLHFGPRPKKFAGPWVRVRFGTRFRVRVSIRVRVSVRVSVRVNYFRDSFSILLRAQHYSMFNRSVP